MTSSHVKRSLPKFGDTGKVFAFCPREAAKQMTIPVGSGLLDGAKYNLPLGQQLRRIQRLEYVLIRARCTSFHMPFTRLSPHSRVAAMEPGCLAGGPGFLFFINAAIIGGLHLV
jgi:hypothetical protein